MLRICVILINYRTIPLTMVLHVRVRACVCHLDRNKKKIHKTYI